MQWLRSLAALAALTMALLISADDADARLEGSLAAGQNAQRPFLSPSGTPVLVAAATDHPATGLQSGSLGGLFNRPGLLSGFAAGFLGSGLLGALFGYGWLSGLGGPAAYLGLGFQLALIVMLVRLIWTWWNGRNAPTFAGLSPRQLADPYLRSRNDLPPGMGTPADAEIESDAGSAHAPDEKAAAHSNVTPE